MPGRRHAAALLVVGVALSACSTSPSPSAGTAPASATAAGSECGDTLRDIVASAQKEGTVTLIATPTDWANYGAVIESYRDMYGVQVRVVDPEATSAEELAAVRGDPGSPDRPDVIDIGSAFTLQAVDEGLVVPYFTTNWPQIPDGMKDPEGRWIGSYFGVMSIATNTDVQPAVPTTWADLLDEKYRGQVTLTGDPRESGTAFGAVVAATLANGGSLDDMRPGVEYFAKLQERGNLVVTDAYDEGTLVSGATPVVLDWSYNLGRPGSDFGQPESPIAISIPSDGVYGAFYTQSIVREAPHPCAARLWLEHITSDTGALGFLNGVAIPARLASLEAFGLVSDSLRQRLPRASLLNALVLSDPSRLVEAKAQVDRLWGPLVLGEG